MMVAIGVVAIAGFGSVSGAAAKSRPVLEVAPAKPSVTAAITVSFKAPKVKPPREYYGAELLIGDKPGTECSGTFRRALLRRVRGGTFTATLKPRSSDLGARTWCNGSAVLTVRRYGPGPLHSPVLARRRFPVGTGKNDPVPTPENLGVKVRITVLSGSTLTATAVGRPDRSAQLSGVLHGMIPGRFKPSTDIDVEQISGSLTPLGAALAKAVFPPDPLCPDTAPPGTFDAIPASSTLLLAASGDAALNLTLNGTASQLFGCGPAGALNGTTTLPLTGHVGPNGLLDLGVGGNVTGIGLPNGSQGGLAASLVLNVDLSGQG